MLRGFVYILKKIGPKTVLGNTTGKGQGGDAKPEARTEKERDIKYVLNHVRAESEIPK